MKNNILFLLLMFVSISGWAKKAPDASYLSTFQNHYLNIKLADCDYSRYPLQNNTKQAVSVSSFLKQHKAFLFDNQQTIQLLYTKKSPYATHYTYQQYIHQVPVYGSQIKVNVDKSNAIYTAFYHTFNTANYTMPTLKKTYSPHKWIEHYYENSTDEISIDTTYTCIIFKNAVAKPVYAAVANITNSTQHWHHQVVIDEALNMVYAKDLRTYFNGKDTMATAKIFNPDPLTTANVIYGDTDSSGRVYQDYNDSNREVLDNQTQEVLIPVCLENGLFTLKSTYVLIKELEAPIAEIPSSINGTFLFTRDQPGFEDVNTLYHLNALKQQINECGYQELVNFAIEVDTHANNGEDNSNFDPDLAMPSLLFGEGGVDDAEDADVIVHEYGHAIVHSAAPYTNNGKQRQSIDEGIGDYLAASYSRSINEFGWEKIFSWDGHNSYWDGRFANTAKKYPDDLGNGIHIDGEIISSALMKIWPIIGKKELDKIVYGSLYNYASNLPMDAAAKAIIKTDSLINDGANYYELWNGLYNFGLLNYQIFAGTDTSICSGKSLRLGVQNLSSPEINISWSPPESLDNPLALNPIAAPAVSTWYTLTASNQNTQERYIDSVFVLVENCGSEEIALINSQNFLAGENLFLKLPNINEINYRVDLFNMQGQKMGLYYEQFVGSTYQLAINNLPVGAYILRVFDNDNEPHIFRFVQAR